MNEAAIAKALATAFLADTMTITAMEARGSHVLGQSCDWIRPLAARIMAAFPGGVRPRRQRVVEIIRQSRAFLLACEEHDFHALNPTLLPTKMHPAQSIRTWNVPSITSTDALARWLGISPAQLDWFSGRFRRSASVRIGSLGHYRYRLLQKSSGQVRLIEIPKWRLAELQRQILTRILNHIPPHAAAHGFRQQHSIHTFVAPHTGQAMVARIDLQDFFPSITLPRVAAVFRTVGYPEAVADALAGLCCHQVPDHVWHSEAGNLGTSSRNQLRLLYRQPHLPQGTPTSPAIANLCAYRLDCRLTGLAQSARATYTRYADDLAFSGDDEFRRSAKSFVLHACACVMEEGFTVHFRKTRIMPAAARQRLAGLVVNGKTNVPREDFDRLKAILTNCIRSGPDSQNREQHVNFQAVLSGRISFVEHINPSRGRKLRTLFEQIVWA
ncbi:MAG: RNA-directed DNA polymerase [Planctomycetaceae bacterium]|nr:RNA-directed DNA polymerase [Planctomycetaceae bacterium]